MFLSCALCVCVYEWEKKRDQEMNASSDQTKNAIKYEREKTFTDQSVYWTEKHVFDDGLIKEENAFNFFSFVRSFRSVGSLSLVR